MHFFFQRLIALPESSSVSAGAYWKDPAVPNLKGAFAESLLFGSHATILHGFRAVPTLIEWMGQGLFRELLDDRRISFAVGSTLTTAYMSNKNLTALQLDGSPGLMSVLTRDPKLLTGRGRALSELSAQGLLPRREQHQIAYKVEQNTVHINDDLYKTAYHAARSDFEGEIGRELDIPRGVNPDSGELPDPHLRHYLNMAAANVNLHLAADLQCDYLIADKLTARTLQKRISDALAAFNLQEGDYRTLLQIEEVPDLGEMLDAGKITFEDIIEISASSNAKAFREWLGNVSRSDSATIVREYQKEVLARQIDSRTVKSIKVIGYTGIGALLAPFDPSGILSGLAINSFDAFILSALQKHWRPKAFLDNLKRYSTKE